MTTPKDRERGADKTKGSGPRPVPHKDSGGEVTPDPDPMHFERTVGGCPTTSRPGSLPFADPTGDEAAEDWDRFLLFCNE